MKKNIILSMIVGTIAGFLIYEKCQSKMICKMEEDDIKFHEFYDILIQWIKVHQKGYTLTDYFRKYNYKTIAIYGMRELGQALLAELKDTEIEVKYAIDKNADNIRVDADVYKPDDDLKKVDVIVVTAVHYYSDIEVGLKEKISCPIVALDDVVYEAYHE